MEHAGMGSLWHAFLIAFAQRVPRQSRNTSLLKILLGYNAENWHMDAEYMCVHFILIDQAGVGSPWHAFLIAFAQWGAATITEYLITHDLTGL
jgi:hypothetical protein